MKTYTLVLKVAAPIFLLIGTLHLVLGPRADVLLGAAIPSEVLSDPVLDSQNRFYGVAFSLYGVLLYLASTDLKRYNPVLKSVLWVFFAGGIARIASAAIVGFPSTLVVGLSALELVLPPLLVLWLYRIDSES